MTSLPQRSTPPKPSSDRRPSGIALWWQAIRPATIPASLVPVLVGTALAYGHYVGRALPAVMAALGAVLIQIGTNLANDYFDFKKGADTDARLGPARVTQRGWLSPEQVINATIVAFVLATFVGLYLVWVGGLPILCIGLVSILCGVLYTGGPKPLGYLGLGDVFVFIFFGPVAVCGTYFVQANTVTMAAVIASVPIGLLVTAILVVNNLRDRKTDALVNKRTLAVRFGERFARVQYATLVLGAYACLVVAVSRGLGGTMWLVPCVTLPFAIRRIVAIWKLDGAALNPELGQTARLAILFGATLAVGVM